LIRAEDEAGGERWTVVNIPALDEQGHYLWLDRYSVAEYRALQATVGEYTWNALYQGNPTQIAGDKIKRAWFEYVPKMPDAVDWFVRAIDFALTEKQTEKHDPDYTATAKGCLFNDWLYLSEPRLWRKSIEDSVSEIMALKYNEPNVTLGMGAIALKYSIIGSLANNGVNIDEYEENTSKVARASAWINLASQGRVKLVGTEKEWEPFMAQWVAFPNGAHDDAVDVVSGISQMLGLYFDATPTPKRKRQPMQMDSLLRKAYG
jgi:predicted phage terminase large subunit-like protein